MANFYNPKYKVEELISFTENAVQVATFQQIKDSLIKKMQEIYGNDIDISSASADGQWIMALALLYDKTFGVIKTMEQNLNVNQATGHYLDILCSYNNIFRKEATYSTCHLLVKSTNGNDYTLSEIGTNQYMIQCVDINGITWTWIDNEPLTIPGDKGVTLEFTCDEIGKINANMNSNFNPEDPNTFTNDTRGDINQVISPNAYLECWQTEDATVGRNEESDSELRSRRTIQLGTNSITVLSGLEGSLRDLPFIQDICIYDNNTNSDITLDRNYDDEPVGNKKYYGDGGEIPDHNVYIVLRYVKNLNPNEKEIAKIILNKMTPGVSTKFTLNNNDICFGKQIEYPYDVIFGDTSITQNIYWKKSSPRAIPMTLNFMVTKDFEAEGIQIYKETICKTIQEYIFDLGYKNTLNIAGIINAINNNARPVNGLIPYICVSGEFKIYDSEEPSQLIDGYDDNTQLQHSHLGYFDYSSNLDSEGEPIEIEGEKAKYTVTFNDFTYDTDKEPSSIESGYVNGYLTIDVEDVIPSQEEQNNG